MEVQDHLKCAEKNKSYSMYSFPFSWQRQELQFLGSEITLKIAAGQQG